MADDNPSRVSQDSLEQQTDHQEYAEIKIFSYKGRLGRIRYLVYSANALFLWLGLTVLLFGLVSSTRHPSQGLVYLFFSTLAILVVVFLGVIVLLTIQRVHDFNRSGWLALLQFIPIVNNISWLVFCIVQGTEGSNQFGTQTPPNTRRLKIMAVIAVILLFLLVVALILAAIIIPRLIEALSA